MAGKKFSLVGRYMSGNEVVGYHLVDIDTNQGKRYSREQMCYLVGAGRVDNCSGQLHKEEVIIRGKGGLEIGSLPIVRRDGSIDHAESLGTIRKGVAPHQAVEQLVAVTAVTQGRNTVGYILRNSAGVERYCDRAKVTELASQGRVGNLRMQTWNGRPLLRGVGCNLNGLASITFADAQAAGLIG